jgi:hypothetical protein
MIYFFKKTAPNAYFKAFGAVYMTYQYRKKGTYFRNIFYLSFLPNIEKCT